MLARPGKFFELPYPLVVVVCEHLSITDLLKFRKISAGFFKAATEEIFRRKTNEALDCQKKLMKAWVLPIQSMSFVRVDQPHSELLLLLLQKSYFNPSVDFIHRSLTLRSLNVSQSKQKLQKIFNESLRWLLNREVPLTKGKVFNIKLLLPYATLSQNEYVDFSRVYINYLSEETDTYFLRLAFELIVLLPIELNPHSLIHLIEKIVWSLSISFRSDLLESGCRLLNKIMRNNDDLLSKTQELLSHFFKAEDAFRFDILMHLDEKFIEDAWMDAACKKIFNNSDNIYSTELIKGYCAIYPFIKFLGKDAQDKFQALMREKIQPTISSQDPADHLTDKALLIQNIFVNSIISQVKNLSNSELINDADSIVILQNLTTLMLIFPKIINRKISSDIFSMTIDLFERISLSWVSEYPGTMGCFVSAFFNIFQFCDEAQKSKVKHFIEKFLGANDSDNCDFKEIIAFKLMQIQNIQILKNFKLLRFDADIFSSHVYISRFRQSQISAFPLWFRLCDAYFQSTVDNHEALITECMKKIGLELIESMSVVYLAIEYATKLFSEKNIIFSEKCLLELSKAFGDLEVEVRQKVLNLFMLMQPDLSQPMIDALLDLEINTFECFYLKQYLAATRHISIQKPDGSFNENDVAVRMRAAGILSS